MFLFFKIKMVNYCLQEINCILTNDVLEYTPHSNLINAAAFNRINTVSDQLLITGKGGGKGWGGGGVGGGSNGF